MHEADGMMGRAETKTLLTTQHHMHPWIDETVF